MFVWSIISKIDAKPKKVKPKGIKMWFLIFLNLLIDLIPMNIGIITACKWAINNKKKNKLNQYPYGYFKISNII